jgi:ZIP family zinc transporter
MPGGRKVSRRVSGKIASDDTLRIVAPKAEGGVHVGAGEASPAYSAFGDISPSPAARSLVLASSWPVVWLAVGTLAVTGVAAARLSGHAGAAGSLVTMEAVWWAGWMTAASSMLGAAPFFLTSARASVPSDAVLGSSNAIAGGMMLAASWSLIVEGLACQRGGASASAAAASAGVAGLGFVAAGAFFGVVVVIAAKALVGAWGGAAELFDGLSATDARRAALLCLVMFLHSATEGVGIGVSFGAREPHEAAASGAHWSLGRFVSLSLAVHNVPEGLATSIALVPRGTPPVDAALWALATSLSQPIFAVVAFSAVAAFEPLLPLGLGFAAGAMAWVSGTELLPEAVQGLQGKGGATLTAAIALAAAAAMAAMQNALR